MSEDRESIEERPMPTRVRDSADRVWQQEPDGWVLWIGGGEGRWSEPRFGSIMDLASEWGPLTPMKDERTEVGG